MDVEQREILNRVDYYCKDLDVTWNKFKGDVVCKIIQEFIQRHLPLSTLKVAGPNVFLDGFPYEFDLLVVDANAKPREFTSSYEPTNVYCILEVKKGGIYTTEQPKKISKNFSDVTSKYPHIKCVYLTVEEVFTTRKPESKNFYKISKEELESRGHGFFALRDLRGKRQLISGEWEKFLAFIAKGRRKSFGSSN